MNILIKGFEEIEKIRAVGRLAAEVLEMIESHVEPGRTTEELNHICHKYITEVQNAKSAALGYLGFPKSICTSVNEVVCHGIPNNKEKLKDGDILNIDVALIKDGFYGDTSRMFFVGKPTNLAKKICRVAKESLYLAIRKVRPGVRLRELGKTIQVFVENKNFSVVREYCGHGIGKNFHEDPQILHYDANDNGVLIESGMVFTIEPMINAGSFKVCVMQDGWTVKTIDNSLSAQYEHTLVVNDSGCEVVTLRKDEQFPKIISHN